MVVIDTFGEPVTEERWHKVELCIKEFIRRYPKHWKAFREDLIANRTEYQEAIVTEGNKDLKAAGWRNTASFPVVYRHGNSEDGLTGQEEDDLVQVASLLDPLKMLLPGIIDSDKPGKKNKLYREFLKRFPVFMPGEKY